jgi:hypothetical protein
MPRPISLPLLYAKLTRLSLNQQREVLKWLQANIQQQESLELTIPIKKGREIITQQGCYRLELVKCGKPACRCATGSLHGPYWYQYWRDGDTVRCKYIGKKLPEDRFS